MIEEVLSEKPLNKRQLAKNETRQKALDSARNLFVERGYRAATIRDIAKAMGMSTGAVFANFAGKEELLLGVLQEDRTAFALRVREANCEPTEDAEIVIQALLTDYDFFESRFRMLEEIRYLDGAGNKIAADFLGTRRRQIKCVLLAGMDSLVFEILWPVYDALSRTAMRDAWTRGEVKGDLERIIGYLGVTAKN